MHGMKKKHYLVSGLVQGVGYRYFVIRNAKELQLTGTVRNLPDGRVEVIAQGESGRLAELENRLRRGPVRASVDELQIDTLDNDTENHDDFKIIY